MHAPVARPHPYAVRLVRSMNEVGRPPQPESVLAQGIVRTRPNLCRKRVTVLRVLGANRGRYDPDRILGAIGHPRRALPGLPALAADADRVGVNDGLLTALVRRIKEE